MSRDDRCAGATAWALGILLVVTATGVAAQPVPDTCWPCWRSATASIAATDDFPTPPLPLTTATTFLM
ncbi:MAG: hypothetical protein R6X25_03820 [Candidatus Krumholzibacteriia bacterium]